MIISLRTRFRAGGGGGGGRAARACELLKEVVKVLGYFKDGLASSGFMSHQGSRGFRGQKALASGFLRILGGLRVLSMHP